MTKRYLEDDAIDERLTTPGRTITESDIHAFAALSGDWHPLHTNVEYARRSQFGERIAHGFLVLSVGPSLIFRLGQHVALSESFITFYGLDRRRFTAPVRIGDTIKLEWKVTTLEPRDDGTGLMAAACSVVTAEDVLYCSHEVTISCRCKPER